MIGAKKRMKKAKRSKVPLIIDTVTGVYAGVGRHVNDLLFRLDLEERAFLINPQITQMAVRLT